MFQEATPALVIDPDVTIVRADIDSVPFSFNEISSAATELGGLQNHPF
jgi:hypothetical protein